ncbi:MAG: hypothetical protein ACI9FN_000296 [Saprospiraceae bacterium]|jgi:hypothetical protein
MKGAETNPEIDGSVSKYRLQTIINKMINLIKISNSRFYVSAANQFIRVF